jgi:hypothetical protein
MAQTLMAIRWMAMFRCINGMSHVNLGHTEGLPLYGLSTYTGQNPNQPL